MVIAKKKAASKKVQSVDEKGQQRQPAAIFRYDLCI